MYVCTYTYIWHTCIEDSRAMNRSEERGVGAMREERAVGKGGRKGRGGGATGRGISREFGKERTTEVVRGRSTHL